MTPNRSGLRPIGDIVREAIPVWALRAIAHHLDLAARATDPHARASAYEEAEGIRSQLGAIWSDVLDLEDAA